MTTQKRAVVYGRVSTRKEEQEQSLDLQTIGLQEICKEKGYKLVDTFAEKGSATNIRKRKEFIKMIENCGLKFIKTQNSTDYFEIDNEKESKYDVIFVKEPSRISRSKGQGIEIINRLRDKGIDIYFESSGQYASNIIDVTLPILFVMAQNESQSTSNRIKYSKRTLAKKGEFRPSKGIYGYKKEYIGNSNKDYKVVVNEEQRATVNRIFDLYINHDYGVMKITNLLNDEGVPSIGKKRGWSDDKIKRIISNPIYYGTPTNHNRTKLDVTEKYYTKKNAEPIPIPNAVEPIISKETFDKAQAIKAERTDKHGKRGINRPKDNTYKGKLFCLHCGARYVKKSNYEDKQSYSCSDKNKYGRNHCTSSMIRITQLEKYIESSEIHLDYSTFHTDYGKLIKELNRAKDKLNSILQAKQNELEHLEVEGKRIRKAIVTVSNDDVTDNELVQEFKSEYNEIKEQQKAIQADIDRIDINAINELSKRVTDKYNALCDLQASDKDSYTLTERIDLLHKVEIGKRGLRIVYNTPSFTDEVKAFNKLFEDTELHIDWYDSNKEHLSYYYYRHKGKDCIPLSRYLLFNRNNLELDEGLQKLIPMFKNDMGNISAEGHERHMINSIKKDKDSDDTLYTYLK